MSSNFEKFKGEITETINIIDSSGVVVSEKNVSNPFIDAPSLLARCNSVDNNDKGKKPTIRIVHHFACSGGTLISKCLSAMPNVFLLSELHPYTDLHIGNGKPKYSPSDILSLSKHANVPNLKELTDEIFVNNIIKANEHINRYAGSLIIRDHTHSDFCIGSEISEKPAIVSLLTPYFNIKNIVTIRNPIDAYSSLVKNNWQHFSPFSFEEYCKRFLKMTEFYCNSDIYHYEDFVTEPSIIMKKMCKSLDLPYSDSFINIFELFNVTGDSGRSSTIISPRSRRGLSDEFKNEVEQSSTYKLIVKKFNY